MTITERTAEVRRRLDEIAATPSRGVWDRRTEHLIRATFAHAAALAGERDHLELYIRRGWDWCQANPEASGFAEKEQKVLDAIEAHKTACDALSDALRMLTPIEGAEMPPTWDAGVAWPEVAA